jgi:hypothetical protein
MNSLSQSVGGISLPEVDLIACRSRLESYRNKVYSMKKSLDDGRRTNKERETLEAEVAHVGDLVQSTDLLKNVMINLHNKCVNEDIAFKNRRLGSVGEYITENIQIIFPFENLVAKVKTEPKRGAKTKLVLIDSDGFERLPHVSEGKLLQELISFSGSFGIIKSFGVPLLYMDESFAASSPENLAKLGDLIKESVDSGMQIIRIEQSPEGYKNIPRREIHLIKDPVRKAVVVKQVLDY